jgi:ABC-type dipeptide/oligopeptide/nickel transport system permease component
VIRTIVTRILWALLALWVAATLVWVFMFIIPGDPARTLTGQSANEKLLQDVRREWGLDRPPLERYLSFMGNLLVGNLGESYFQQRPVSEILLEAFGRTVYLAGAAIVLATAAGILIGAASVRKGRAVEALFNTGTLAGISLPTFLIGMLLMLVFASKLRWLPPSGWGDGWTLLGVRAPSLPNLVLPALTLAVFPTALLARVTRAALMEQIGAEHIGAARARGVSPAALLWRHALRNALGPITTLVGLMAASLLGGAIATEIVFSWPGIGRTVYQAIEKRDLFVVEGAVLMLTAIFLAANLLVDLTYSIIDPRIRRAVS